MTTNENAPAGRLRGGADELVRNRIVAFPGHRRHPLTLSERAAIYRANVLTCCGCGGPVHPAGNTDEFCDDCKHGLDTYRRHAVYLNITRCLVG